MTYFINSLINLTVSLQVQVLQVLYKCVCVCVLQSLETIL